MEYEAEIIDNIENSKIGLVKLGVYNEHLSKINNELNKFTKLEIGDYFVEERKFLELYKVNLKKEVFLFHYANVKPDLNEEANKIIPKLKISRAEIYTPETLLFNGTIKPSEYIDLIEFSKISVNEDMLVIETENSIEAIKKKNIYDIPKIKSLTLFSFVDTHLGHLAWLMRYWNKEVISFIKRWKKLSWNPKAIKNYRDGKFMNKKYIEYRAIDKDEFEDLLKYLGAKINHSILLDFIVKNKDKISNEKLLTYEVLKDLLRKYNVDAERFIEIKFERYAEKYRVSEEILKARHRKYLDTILDLWGE